MPSIHPGSGLRRRLSQLAVPGMYLVYKYTQYKRTQQEHHRKKETEKELLCLNHKIDKLLNNLDDPDGKEQFSEEEECVVCLFAKASMQTFPCGHKVVCRKCFIKTIQVAVSQRSLPLLCVVCRTKVLRLTQSRDTSPLTPPRSRRNIQLPWQRDHSGSPARGRRSECHTSRSSSRSSSLVRQLFRSSGGTSPSRHQSKHHSGHTPSKTGSVQSKPVATRLMQPMLIYPSDNLQPHHIAFTPPSVLKKDGISSDRRKKVRFASPLRSESPARLANPSNHTIDNKDCWVANPSNQTVDNKDCSAIMQHISPKHILRNTANSRIPTIRSSECYSPQQARCYVTHDMDNHRDGLYAPSPKLIKSGV